jgi:putative tryptophan/tyrosine transport system substrate-binding protein
MGIARRTLLTGGLAAIGSGRPLAQSSRVPRVGFLTPASSDRTIPISAFRTALAELGYVEGQNVILEFRLAHGDISRLPALARSWPLCLPT